MNLNLPQYDYLASLEQLANDYFLGLNNLLGGAVMGKLNEYAFFMHKNEFKKITETLKADFTSYQPIKGQEVLGMAVSYSRTINLNGILVAEPIEAVEPLKWLVKIGKPIRFTTLESDLNVVITGLVATKNYFEIDGKHTVQTYNISLKEIYGNLS